MPDDNTSGGNVLTRKYYGLPGWGWVGLAAATGVVALVWIQNRRNSAAASQTSSTTSQDNTPVPGTAQGLATDQYESLLAILRDIQGQASQPVTPAPGDGGTTTTDQGQYASVLAGWPVAQWISDIQAHGPSPLGTPGSGGPHPDFNWSKFIELNPQAKSNITTGDANGKFIAPYLYRIA